MLPESPAIWRSMPSSPPWQPFLAVGLVLNTSRRWISSSLGSQEETGLVAQNPRERGGHLKIWCLCPLLCVTAGGHYLVTSLEVEEDIEDAYIKWIFQSQLLLYWILFCFKNISKPFLSIKFMFDKAKIWIPWGYPG